MHFCDIVPVSLVNDAPIGEYGACTGIYSVRSELDWFFLNRERPPIVGLYRHKLFRYVRLAAPDRLMRQSAEMFLCRLNCSIARCSDYPESRTSFNVFDELGPPVWEGVPGCGYPGNDA